MQRRYFLARAHVCVQHEHSRKSRIIVDEERFNDNRHSPLTINVQSQSLSRVQYNKNVPLRAHTLTHLHAHSQTRAHTVSRTLKCARALANTARALMCYKTQHNVTSEDQKAVVKKRKHHWCGLSAIGLRTPVVPSKISAATLAGSLFVTTREHQTAEEVGKENDQKTVTTTITNTNTTTSNNKE